MDWRNLYSFLLWPLRVQRNLAKIYWLGRKTSDRSVTSVIIAVGGWTGGNCILSSLLWPVASWSSSSKIDWLGCELSYHCYEQMDWSDLYAFISTVAALLFQDHLTNQAKMVLKEAWSLLCGSLSQEIWRERFEKKWCLNRGGISSGWTYIRGSIVQRIWMRVVPVTYELCQAQGLQIV